MSAIDAAERFVKLVGNDAPTPARLAEAEGLLKALAAVRWEEASPQEREAGWGLTLRLSLLKHAPGREKRQASDVTRLTAPSPA